MTVIVVVWVRPPPFPVIVMVRLPRRAFRLTLIVMVDVPAPGAAIVLGLKVTVKPLAPDADKETAELKPPEIDVVMVDVPEVDLAMLTVVGDALRVKFGFVPVTVSTTVVVATMLPEVPVTVTG